MRQFPPVLQRLGLEWAYRLAMEPRRLFKRYFTYNSLFLYHIARDQMRDRAPEARQTLLARIPDSR